MDGVRRVRAECLDLEVWSDSFCANLVEARLLSPMKSLYDENKNQITPFSRDPDRSVPGEILRSCRIEAALCQRENSMGSGL